MKPMASVIAFAIPIFLGYLAVPAAAFEDDKTYPGNNCQPQTNDQPIRRFAAIENLDVATRTFFCPIVRDVGNDDVELVEVYVSDRSPTGGITCCFDTAALNENVRSGPCASTGTTFQGSATLQFGAGTPNVGSTSPFRYYFLDCTLPPFNPDQPGLTKFGSAIISYRLYENNLED